MPQTTLADPRDRPEEGWDDPARGGIRWRTLLSRGLTDTEGLTCGIATLRAGEHWVIHSHREPELYFGIMGEFDVEVDGRLHRLGPEVALWIPGDAPHGIPQVAADVRFLYAFAADSFDGIEYAFPDDAS